MTARREFLRTSAAAVAALALPWPPATGTTGDRLERIGVQLYTVRKEMARDFEGTLRRVAELGFDEVEFAGYFDHTARQVRDILDRLELTSPAGHMPYEALANDAEWQRTLDTAKGVGHQYVVIAWTPQEARRTLDDWKRVAERFNWAGGKAREAGLGFAYHNHDFEFTPLGPGPLPFDLLLAETDPALVKIEMDLYWITLGGQDPLRYFQAHPGRFPMVHVKDMKREAARPLMVDVGQGDIDFRTIFGHRGQAGTRHFFVEHDEPADPFASIRNSYQYLKDLRF